MSIEIYTGEVTDEKTPEIQRTIYLVGTASKKIRNFAWFGWVVFCLVVFSFFQTMFKYVNKYKKGSAKNTAKCIMIGAYKNCVD